VATGIARAAVDALKELAGSKIPRGHTGLLRDQAQIQEWVGRAEALIRSGQAFRTAAVGDLWETVNTGRAPDLDLVARSRLAAAYAADGAMQATDLAFRAGGTTSVVRAQTIARCWRDIHVVGQHLNLLPDHYILAGRVFLGLDPGPKLA
jgi:alkylation response protein AidB-like acyl-CoA dehydrogenase